jgi:hypothetical protein
MKTNIVLELDADLVRELRAHAAKDGTLLNAFLVRWLRPLVRERAAYRRARSRALARLERGFDLQWKRPDSRAELHRR